MWVSVLRLSILILPPSPQLINPGSCTIASCYFQIQKLPRHQVFRFFFLQRLVLSQALENGEDWELGRIALAIDAGSFVGFLCVVRSSVTDAGLED